MTRGAVEGLRLSLGLLTVVPVGQVRSDRTTARAAMLLAPLVGALLGLLAWAVGAAFAVAGAGPLLAAVLAVSVLALATRGLHLDGLADVADGLGSGRPAADALGIMRKSDIGPFGVLTLVLVLLVQVGALTQLWAEGLAGPALVLAGVTGRLALPWGCRTGVPAARPDGLGALVAGSVPPAAAAGSTALLLLALVGLGLIGGVRPALALGAGLLVGTAVGQLLLRHAVSRLGGVTGDVLGGAVEIAATAALLTLLLVAV